MIYSIFHSMLSSKINLTIFTDEISWVVMLDFIEHHIGKVPNDKEFWRKLLCQMSCLVSCKKFPGGGKFSFSSMM